MSEDSMTKYSHRITAEESVDSFIAYIEMSTGEDLSLRQKIWLRKKGQEIFDDYYVENMVEVRLVSETDKQDLLSYFSDVEDVLGKMFAHIMLIEFRLYLVTNE